MSDARVALGKLGEDLAVAELERESSSELLALAESSRSSRRGGMLTTPGEIAPAASLAPRPRSVFASQGVAVGVGVLVLAGIGAVGFALGEKRHSGDTKRATANGSAAAPSGIASLTSPASASVRSDLVVPGEVTSAQPAPAAPVEPPASAASASGAPRAASVPKGAPRATVGRSTASTSKAACENPYIFDSNGIRHIKVECVRP